MQICGVSQRGAAFLLDVRYDTIKNWYYGRARVPAGVMADLEEYKAQACRVFGLDEEEE